MKTSLDISPVEFEDMLIEQLNAQPQLKGKFKKGDVIIEVRTPSLEKYEPIDNIRLTLTINK